MRKRTSLFYSNTKYKQIDRQTGRKTGKHKNTRALESQRERERERERERVFTSVTSFVF